MTKSGSWDGPGLLQCCIFFGRQIWASLWEDRLQDEVRWVFDGEPWKEGHQWKKVCSLTTVFGCKQFLVHLCFGKHTRSFEWQMTLNWTNSTAYTDLLYKDFARHFSFAFFLKIVLLWFPLRNAHTFLLLIDCLLCLPLVTLTLYLQVCYCLAFSIIYKINVFSNEGLMCKISNTLLLSATEAGKVDILLVLLYFRNL